MHRIAAVTGRRLYPWVRTEVRQPKKGDIVQARIWPDDAPAAAVVFDAFGDYGPLTIEVSYGGSSLPRATLVYDAELSAGMTWRWGDE